MKRRTQRLRLAALAMALLLLCSLFQMGLGLERRSPNALPDISTQTIVPESPAASPESPPADTEGQQPPTEDEQPPEEPEVPPEETPLGDTQSPEQEPPPADEPSTDVPGSGGHTGGGEEGGENGGNGSTGENGGTDVPTDGPQDDTKLRIVTDLCNCTITYDQLQNDTLPFYAYIINGNKMTLKVKLHNSATSQNGQYLTGSGQNYTAKLQRGEVNRFTLYIKNGSQTVHEVTYLVRYMAQKADADHPTVGEHPPVIQTNLEGVTELSNRNFTLTVQARDYHGKAIVASNMEVRMDGRRIDQPTGGPVYEYELYFPNPDIGDTTQHHITITAWDNEGNSTYVAYDITYRFIDSGEVIGTATIILDATTVGLDVMEEPFTYKIKQGEPASYAILAMLEEYGYEVTYAGTPDVGFYIRRISRGGMMDYYSIPDNLWQKIRLDGLNLTGQHDNDSLGEFDFTQGSGWVYSVGGETYAGKGLSNYYLSGGDTLYLRYTLAYGKDVGGYVDEDSGSYGTLKSYCGKWLNGQYIPAHLWGEELHTDPASCTKDGQVYQLCTVCGEKNVQEILAAPGHDWEEIQHIEPADGADGKIIYRCRRCGEQKEEVIPWTQTSGNGEKRRFRASPAA